ncbi:siderophore biosynthesis protein SbnG [Marinobacterium nitratireducens]|uniref:Siderophore biosynthesis protein SbnG n=1 Tax=Marinobacterium nitratireducens TaxID=518897 RepID=A0A918DU83_9GAMM|nr:aldolase/citrate lyase family protein [Marinobacterium nitratireducens]GGO84118.1 siderophore biosynthesis protein SbnG [Marinobacterium nitratireducens]
MLQSNPLKRRLRAGASVCGMLNSVPSPWLVEMLGYAGYDFVILDQEHLGVNPESLEHMIRAAESAGIAPLVRVPGIDPAAIQRALDAGALGVVVPRVESADEARAVVAAARYHPLGRRGITGGRTTGFGTLPLGDYLARANDEILVVLMIESQRGVDNLDAILQAPGLDWILEGAMDLAHDLGVAPDHLHPQVQQAIATTARKTREAGLLFCAIPRVEGQFERWREEGVSTFLLGEDRGILFRRLQAYRRGFESDECRD